MKTSCVLVAGLLLLIATVPSTADEVYIYGGRGKHEYFDFQTNQVTPSSLYVVLDLTTRKFTLFLIDSKKKTYERQGGNVTTWIDYPYSPQKDQRTRTFIYVDSENNADSINFKRFRSTSGPAMLPISGVASKLLPRSFAFSSSFRLSTLLVEELSGTLTFLRDPTKQSNDALNDLPTAEQLVVDYLKARKLIN